MSTFQVTSLIQFQLFTPGIIYLFFVCVNKPYFVRIHFQLSSCIRKVKFHLDIVNFPLYHTLLTTPLSAQEIMFPEAVQSHIWWPFAFSNPSKFDDF